MDGSRANCARLVWIGESKPAQFASQCRLEGVIDLATGRSISPIVAAALCIKQRVLLTASQAAKVDTMKTHWPEFATMRRLAMRFRGLLKSKNVSKLGVWLKNAQKSSLYAMQRFARTPQRDIDAVRNAITEPWSNGQTEGQINRLKALNERCMVELGSSMHACFLQRALQQQVRKNPFAGFFGAKFDILKP